MRFLRFPLMLMLLALAGMALTGCKTHDNTVPAVTNPSNPNGPSNPPGFCDDPSQLFTIVSVEPTSGSFDASTGVWSSVSITSNVVVTFNHPPAKASLTKNVIGFTLASDTTQQLPYTVTVSGNKATFDPTANLKPGTNYLFYIQADGASYGPRAAECDKAGSNPKYLTILDSAGNPSTDPDPHNNTPIDTTPAGSPLAVTGITPADGKTAGTDVKPQVSFNQPVDPSSVVCDGSAGASILLQETAPTAAQVAGSCAVSKDGNSVTFTPNGNLDDGASYTVTVTSGGIKPVDTTAKPLTSDYISHFKTSSLLNTKDCEVPLAGPSTEPGNGICVLGNNGKGGLVDVLLDPTTGPLAPLAANIGGADKLKDALVTLLQSDDGSLQGIVTGLLQKGQLQDGLQQLLISKDGLQSILPELLIPGPNNPGLTGLLGTDGGAADLLQSLLIDGNDMADCQAAAGTVCLVGQNGQHGLLDTLLGDSGYLGQEGLSTGDLVQTLGDTLASDGSLKGIVTGLFQKGQLQQGLQTLLQGQNGKPGLADAIQSLLGGLPGALGNILGGLLGGLVPSP